jgi:hypothetical protein
MHNSLFLMEINALHGILFPVQRNAGKMDAQFVYLPRREVSCILTALIVDRRRLNCLTLGTVPSIEENCASMIIFSQEECHVRRTVHSREGCCTQCTVPYRKNCSAAQNVSIKEECCTWRTVPGKESRCTGHTVPNKEECGTWHTVPNKEGC